MTMLHPPPPHIELTMLSIGRLINEEEMLNPCVLPWKSHETMEERDNTPTVFKSITPVIFWLFI